MFSLAYLKPSEFGRITASIFGISTVAVVLYSQLDLFKEGLEFLSLRFEEAANVEGNPIEAFFNRYFEILLVPLDYGKFDIVEMDWDQQLEQAPHLEDIFGVKTHGEELL